MNSLAFQLAIVLFSAVCQNWPRLNSVAFESFMVLLPMICENFAKNISRFCDCQMCEILMIYISG